MILGAANDTLVVSVLHQALIYGTPLLFAALGELLAERSGVLNLGVEGMMLVGAVMAFWVDQRVHASAAVVLILAVGMAALSGALLSLIHAFLVVTLRANQIVSGLTLSIFAGALGLSSYLGNDLSLTDVPGNHQFADIDVFGFKDVPVIGPIVFNQTALVYGSWALTIAIMIYLSYTRWGLNVRAVGESPAAADAMGINVALYRYVHVMIGGALAGVGGSCFTLAIVGNWSAGVTGGAGWIAIALVIFAFWRPELCVLGAYLFGGLSALPYALQGHGYNVTPEFWQALPYVGTIAVLVLVSSGWAKRRLGAPAALGIPYVREER